uniref:Death domain-containing protein n=1 Tax=Amphimedon queenslandica TaxID=400682 RepID=A0A1X7TBW5_AMPQE
MLKSGPDRQEISKKLCDKILIDKNSNDIFPMPVRWFAFELTLLKKAGNGSCLKTHDVLSIGRSLEMKKEDTEQALLYLHNSTIILYYPEVLPDIVFVDPHPILDTLSRLLALTYKIDVTLLTKKRVDIIDSDNLHKLRKRGTFTESLLDMLNGDKGFSTSDFIRLLLHLHIIAKTEDDDYFIPSALPSYTGTHPGSDTVNPLLIVWQNSNKEILPVPRGIFPLAVVNLMIKINKLKKVKNLQFCFPLATNQESQKYFRYQDAMSFCVDDVFNDIQVGTIHFIKKHRHIEIHFTGHKDDALKYCPEIREAVTEAINSSSVAINLKLSHKLAFACCSTEKCYCIVTNEAEETIKCTLCPKRAIISGQEKYWTWFHVTHQSSTEVMTNPCTLDITRLKDVRSSLQESNFFESKWLDLSDQLGLLPDTSDFIETNYSDVSRRLRETLIKWLDGADDASPSWGSLVKALEAIGQKNVAEHIKWLLERRPLVLYAIVHRSKPHEGCNKDDGLFKTSVLTSDDFLQRSTWFLKEVYFSVSHVFTLSRVSA